LRDELWQTTIGTSEEEAVEEGKEKKGPKHNVLGGTPPKNPKRGTVRFGGKVWRGNGQGGSKVGKATRYRMMVCRVN